MPDNREEEKAPVKQLLQTYGRCPVSLSVTQRVRLSTAKLKRNKGDLFFSNKGTCSHNLWVVASIDQEQTATKYIRVRFTSC